MSNGMEIFLLCQYSRFPSAHIRLNITCLSASDKAFQINIFQQQQTHSFADCKRSRKIKSFGTSYIGKYRKHRNKTTTKVFILKQKGVNTDSGSTAIEATFDGIEKFKVNNQVLFPITADL